MNGDGGSFPPRDERLGRALEAADPIRLRGDEGWNELRERISDAARMPLARRRRAVWYGPLTEQARSLGAVAAVLLIVLGTLVYSTPRTQPVVAEAAPTQVDLLSEEEFRAYFPGMDNPDRLLEAAIVLR
jgi:hypothetical protein